MIPGCCWAGDHFFYNRERMKYSTIAAIRQMVGQEGLIFYVIVDNRGIYAIMKRISSERQVV